MTEASELQSCLSRFGLTEFRPGQLDVIGSVMEGLDCLCIMPTGGGKSLCYQLPAVARKGVTLVVSPLIALMKDQVDTLNERGIHATFINSSIAPNEQRDRLAGMEAGEYDLVYVAPERFRSSSFFHAVNRCGVSLLAVDEAHCVSEWGHDFRPDYAKLGGFRRKLGYPQTIALTATATPTVQADIAKTLELREPKTFVTGFTRPNLRLEVQNTYNKEAKFDALDAFLQTNPGSGIIYASTRKKCEELVEALPDFTDRRVGYYHAGLEPDARRKIQERFMSGQIDIIVATNAFGMGIDKADLRFVVHYTFPGTLEAYYQEAGRAGRDGKDSRCLLLFSDGDRHTQEFFIENSYPTREAVSKVYEHLRGCTDDPIEVTQMELKSRLDLTIGTSGIGACEQLLEKAGAIERLDRGDNMAAIRINSDQPTLVDVLPRESKIRRKVLRALERIVGDLRHERVYFHLADVGERTGLERDQILRALRRLNELESLNFIPPFRGRAIQVCDRKKPFSKLDLDFEDLDRRREAEYDKLRKVIAYARSRQCRQVEIVKYFGDPKAQRCGCCDNCPSTRKIEVSSEKPKVIADNGALLQAVRMALSGVARLKSRFGKTVIAQMLFGSQSGKLTKHQIDQLSTFGLLDQLKLTEITELLDTMLLDGLIEQTDVQRGRPVVKISDYGAEVMKGTEDLPADFSLSKMLRLKINRKYKSVAAKPKPAAKPVVDESPTEEPGYEAEEPTYESYSDEFSGDDDVETEPLLSDDAKAENREAGDLQPSSKPGEIDRANAPDWFWTWTLLNEGFPLEECQKIRNRKRLELLADLRLAQEAGFNVLPEWYLSQESLDDWQLEPHSQGPAR